MRRPDCDVKQVGIGGSARVASWAALGTRTALNIAESSGAGRASRSRQYPSDQRCCAVSGNRVRPSSLRAVSRTACCCSQHLAIESRLIIELSFNYLLLSCNKYFSGQPSVWSFNRDWMVKSLTRVAFLRGCKSCWAAALSGFAHSV